MLIDTHAHLNFSAFKEDLDLVIKKCLENEIWLINVGTKYETSKKALEITKKYEGVFAAIGLHPLHLETGLMKIKNDKGEISDEIREEGFDYQRYKNLANFEKVVAIGEIGLDYYWRPKTTKKKELFKQKQKALLGKQLELAKELNLPVIFHCRLAHQDLIQFLKENERIRPKKATIHGFVGNLEDLKEYLNLGYYVGFNGIIFRNIEGINFEKVVRNTPLERILIETDCPYLSPPGFQERNNPEGIKLVAGKIAQIKNLSFEKLTEQTTRNARKLFRI